MNRVYDVAIIGCGHAGSEAALAAARTGADVIVFCLNFNLAASMPCNPSIGGSAKGQIVGEIDALGGVMGLAADATYMQIKRLNQSRGPAVHALRTQNDKYQYPSFVQNIIKKQKNIHILEEEVIDFNVTQSRITHVICASGKMFHVKTCVITTGTYLKGVTHIGFTNKSEGRMGEPPSNDLSNSLKTLGLRLGRLKTGTTPRLCANSLDFTKMDPQPGDTIPLHFSFKSKPNNSTKNQVACYLTNTNDRSHKIILNNLHQSPMYQGIITGSGPRYCPSLEDKVVRFSDKQSHHLFIEPESFSSTEIYVQGFNTSLPEAVQREVIDTIPGLMNADILKPGYAVEYDYVYPDQLLATLQLKSIPNLFFAGQINGTSGYEEAAAQGLVAGLNASKVAGSKTPVIVSRETSYIGTMIDDLTYKNVISEPYRMLTSRSEFRLLLRQDNAIFRLSEFGYSHGLLSDSDIQRVRQLKHDLESCIEDTRRLSFQSTDMPNMSMHDAIKRPQLSVSDIYSQFNGKYSFQTVERATIQIRYSGYIQRQEREIEKLRSFELLTIPPQLNYQEVAGLRIESRHQLEKYRPQNFRDAKRISGVNPADLMILLSHVKHR